MENNKKDGFYEKIRKEQSRSGSRPSFDEKLKKLKFDDKMAQYYEIRNKILSDVEFLKMFMVIAMKEITWRKELENQFDCHPSKITEFFNYFKKEGFILYSPLVKVDGILFETVIKQNTNAFYGKRDTVRVFTLSPEGKEFSQKLFDDIIKVTNKRTDLQVHVNFVISKTKSHKLTYNKIMEEELSENERRVQYPDGVVYTHKTIRAMKFEKEIAEARIEIRQEMLLKKQTQNALTHQEGGQLALIQENKALMVQEQISKGNERSFYDGIGKNLSSVELDLVMTGEGFIDEETGLFVRYEKETPKSIRDAKTKLKADNQERDQVALEDPFTSMLVGGIHKRLREIHAPHTLTQSKSKTAEEEADEVFASLGL